MRKALSFLVLGLTALFVGMLMMPLVAHAQDAAASAATGTTVSVPWGDWLLDCAAAMASVAAAGLVWLCRFLPASVRALVQTAQVEQVLQKAITYGINAVAGAEKGKTLSVDVGNSVVAEALNYAVTHGPSWLQGWVGGPDALAQKIIARLDLEAASQATTPSAAAAAVAASPPTPTTTTLTAAAA